MPEFFVEAELSVLNFLNNLHTPLLDSIFVFITHLGDKGLLWIMLGLVLVFIPKYKKAGYCVLLALLINLIICNITLKPLFARIRPYEYVDGLKLLIEKPHDFSFPSGHSAASFAASMALYLNFKKTGIPFLVIAFLIAFSRLYLHVHFPSDVICGILLGIASAFVSCKLVSKTKLFSA